jgi:hemoglobin
MPLPENDMPHRILLALASLLYVGAATAATPSHESTPVGATEVATHAIAQAGEVATPVAPAGSEEQADDAPIDPFANPDAPHDNRAEQAAVRAALQRGSAPDPAPADPSLRAVFEQFGGEPGLVALMDELMTRMLADPRLRSYFQQVDQAAVKKHLVEQVCAILGGGCTYTGRDMRRAHAGLGIDRADFNALVEDLQRAMDAKGIPFRAQNRLLAKLAPMHREIEEK